MELKSNQKSSIIICHFENNSGDIETIKCFIFFAVKCSKLWYKSKKKKHKSKVIQSLLNKKKKVKFTLYTSSWYTLFNLLNVHNTLFVVIFFAQE